MYILLWFQQDFEFHCLVVKKTLTTDRVNGSEHKRESGSMAMQLLVQQMPLQWHSSFINKLCCRLCLLVSLLWNLYDVHQENRLSWEWATNKQLRLLYHVFEKGVISGKELAEKKSLVLDILHKQQSMIIHFQDKNPAHIMSSKLSSAPEPQQAFCHQVRLACLNQK